MDLEKTQLVSQLSHSFLSSVLENLSQKTDFFGISTTPITAIDNYFFKPKLKDYFLAFAAAAFDCLIMLR